MANTPFSILPSRIRYYLLDYKDKHIQEVVEEYGTSRLNDMTKDQLQDLFEKVIGHDMVQTFIPAPKKSWNDYNVHKPHDGQEIVVRYSDEDFDPITYSEVDSHRYNFVEWLPAKEVLK